MYIFHRIYKNVIVENIQTITNTIWFKYVFEATNRIIVNNRRITFDSPRRNVNCVPVGWISGIRYV